MDYTQGYESTEKVQVQTGMNMLIQIETVLLALLYAKDCCTYEIF
jgi:hypothetical protein